MISIVFAGDVCPIGKVQDAFVDGKAYEIFHDLLEEIAGADLSVVNLECPLVSQQTPITKAGLILSASSRCIQGFVAAQWNVLNLANNHSFDHGADGLRDTIQAIKGAGLNVIGAGSNLKEAQTPLITEINGKRIVIYSMAEHEYSIADEKTPGSNPLDLINFVNAIRLYKQQGIFVVLLHGGKEHYPYPSPEMVRRCRFMVDMGADAVICCHAHIPLPWEIYADRPIVYGLGNLVFEPRKSMKDGWYEGYLARLIIDETRVRMETVPYFQSKTNAGAQKMNEHERQRFLDEMERKNSQVKDNEFLEDRWAKQCRHQKEEYLAELFGYNRLMRKVSRLLLNTLHSKNQLLNSLLLSQCETHQEVLTSIFKDERQGG